MDALEEGRGRGGEKCGVWLEHSDEQQLEQDRHFHNLNAA